MTESFCYPNENFLELNIANDSRGTATYLEPDSTQAKGPKLTLNSNLNDLLNAFNKQLGFVLFNSNKAFLVYLAIVTGIRLQNLIALI